jgi:hypothetical protein
MPTIALACQLHIADQSTGAPACIVCFFAADPTSAEIIAGVNLADVAKCNCTSRFCTAAAAGVLPFSAAAASDKVSIAGTDPHFVFDDLPADTFCTNCELTLPLLPSSSDINRT